MRLTSAWACLILVVAGCGDDGGTDAGGTDGGRVDSGGIDGGGTDGGGTDGGGTDGGGTDGGGTDGGGTDGGGIDGGGTDGGECADCVEGTLSWGAVGGFTPIQRSSELEPCRSYTLTEMNLSSGTTRSCTSLVPCAGDAVTVADLLAALMDADVTAAISAAMSMGGTILYGRDDRPVDGQIFEIRLPGATIQVGSDCAGGPGPCTPIPAGVDALRDLLQAIDLDRIASEDCAATFPDG